MEAERLTTNHQPPTSLVSHKRLTELSTPIALDFDENSSVTADSAVLRISASTRREVDVELQQTHRSRTFDGHWH